jgi:hypothetical protein
MNDYEDQWVASMVASAEELGEAWLVERLRKEAGRELAGLGRDPERALAYAEQRLAAWLAVIREVRSDRDTDTERGPIDGAGDGGGAGGGEPGGGERRGGNGHHRGGD